MQATMRAMQFDAASRIVSVANLTRADGEAFLAIAPTVPVRTVAVPYPLAEERNRFAPEKRRDLTWRKSDG